MSIPNAQPPIEPGILQTFRWLMAGVCILMSANLTNAFNTQAKTPEDHAIIVTWLFTGGLFLYLSHTGLARSRPNIHLWIALILIGVIPIVSGHLLNGLYLASGGTEYDKLLHPAGLYLWLIPPLLFISAQYDLRYMFAFVIGTSVLSITLAVWSQQRWGIPTGPDVNQATARLVIFPMIGTIVNRISAVQRKLRHQLAEKNAQIAEYASRLEALAVTRERNRMARELHDTLAHTLSAVEIQLKVVDILIDKDPAGARERLHETQQITRAALQEARRALHDLRASPIEEFGLLLALKRLTERAADRTGAEAIVTLPAHSPNLPAQEQQQLYRIAEEALNNMVRHAKATHFWLSLRVEGHLTELQIKDNGVGFNVNPAPTARYGLRGMAERAALIQAKFQVASTPGVGTSITVTLGETQ